MNQEFHPLERRYVDGSYLAATETWHVDDSPWKAEKVVELLRKHRGSTARVVDVGCGAGGVLKALAELDDFRGSALVGYDLSPDAIRIARSTVPVEEVRFVVGDAFASEAESEIDVLLCLDVVEHVPDYLGFLDACRRLRPKRVVFHIPLDVHVSSVVRRSVGSARSTIGHLHYFTAETALDTLRDCGFVIVDYKLTDGAVALARAGASWQRRVANLFRHWVGLANPALSARLFGGYSLLVLVS